MLVLHYRGLPRLTSLTGKHKMQRHQIGGVFFALAATVLLSLATFSTPFSSHIYFIRALESFGQIRFGGFGWCNLATAECEGPVLGYGFGGGQVTVWLTGAEVTIGIAAIFSLFATIAIALDTLFRSSYALQNPLWFRAFAVFASLFSILAFVFSAVLWYDTRVKFVRSGIEAKYGPALWILLGGTIAAALSLCAGGPRFTGRHLYRANNEASYTV
ncbi:hypothetical protein NliqN6_1565 [Naganishia liquefaciens]|uniref:Pali-domain-containing protein n=1 Tax=Naganishia liquefaciens TaxID=104408 RepID=A0A8H3YDF5_9TREE|nr:hypothetical protein NliqN6_1565 [Naganishia liquefaciens]